MIHTVEASISYHNLQYGGLFERMERPLPELTCSGNGRWNSSRFKINSLEALTEFLTLKRLNPKRGSHIRLVMDSNTILRYIKRCGSRSPQINHVVLAILGLYRRRGWHVTAAH